MKNFMLFLLAIFLHSGAFAETDFDQSTHIFRIAPLPGTENNAGDDCKAAAAASGLAILPDTFPGPNSIAARVPLESVHTKKTNGELKGPIKNIGEALVCQDWDSFVFAGLGNFVPVIYVVDINGKTFLAEGGGFSPALGQLPGGGQIMAPQDPFIPLFFPAPGLILFNVSTTILPALPVDNPFVTSDGSGGTMTINSLLDVADPQGLDDRFVTEGIGVIRFLDPIDD